MFLSIEGADRTGKDSILLALDKKVRWANCNMMRGPAGCLTYDKIYNRETKERRIEAISVAETIKSTRHLIVYLYANVETIKDRLQEEINAGGKGEFAPNGWSIEDVLNLYESNIDFLYNENEVLKINTTNYSIDECVQLIVDKMDEIRKLDFQLTPDTDAKDVKSPNKGEFEYYPYNPFYHIYTKDELEGKEFDINVDKPYYEMLEKTLVHKLYEYELGWINDRQLVYTSSDCISYIQVKVTDEKLTWFVSQRSCDIEKHKLNDIVFFKYISEKVYPGINFEIRYSCAFPHKYIKTDNIFDYQIVI